MNELAQFLGYVTKVFGFGRMAAMIAALGVTALLRVTLRM